MTAGISSVEEPQFDHKVVCHSHWRDAMTTELEAMESNKTRDVVSLTHGHHIVGCRWIYKVKHRSDGSIEQLRLAQ